MFHLPHATLKSTLIGQNRLTFENTIYQEKGMARACMKRLRTVDKGKRYVETVALGATFSLTTLLRMQREVKLLLLQEFRCLIMN